MDFAELVRSCTENDSETFKTLSIALDLHGRHRGIVNSRGELVPVLQFVCEEGTKAAKRWAIAPFNRGVLECTVVDKQFVAGMLRFSGVDERYVPELCDVAAFKKMARDWIASREHTAVLLMTKEFELAAWKPSGVFEDLSESEREDWLFRWPSSVADFYRLTSRDQDLTRDMVLKHVQDHGACEERYGILLRAATKPFCHCDRHMYYNLLFKLNHCPSCTEILTENMPEFVCSHEILMLKSASMKQKAVVLRIVGQPIYVRWIMDDSSVPSCSEIAQMLRDLVTEGVGDLINFSRVTGEEIIKVPSIIDDVQDVDRGLPYLSFLHAIKTSQPTAEVAARWLLSGNHIDYVKKSKVLKKYIMKDWRNSNSEALSQVSEALALGSS